MYEIRLLIGRASVMPILFYSMDVFQFLSEVSVAFNILTSPPFLKCLFFPWNHTLLPYGSLLLNLLLHCTISEILTFLQVWYQKLFKSTFVLYDSNHSNSFISHPNADGIWTLYLLLPNDRADITFCEGVTGVSNKICALNIFSQNLILFPSCASL